nr:hypothetical protein [uncultured bacterium]
MNDEDLYLEATNEVEGETKSPSLWAKVMALSEGDEAKAKYKYIKLRVEQLANERKNALPKFTKKTVDKLDLKYMPVAEFSKIKAIPEDKVIKMIRDGFYMGQIKNDAWYVSREEIQNSNQAPSIPEQKQSKALSTEKEYIPVEEFAELKGITPEKAIQMIRDGFYQGRIIDEKWYVSYSEISDNKITGNGGELGFKWWQIWAWLGLTIGNLYTFGVLSEQVGLAVFLIILNSILMIMILKFNKYAFLIATILSLNPLLWIINGIYLKNRWNHPKVNVPINK